MSALHSSIQTFQRDNFQRHLTIKQILSIISGCKKSFKVFLTNTMAKANTLETRQQPNRLHHSSSLTKTDCISKLYTHSCTKRWLAENLLYHILENLNDICGNVETRWKLCIPSLYSHTSKKLYPLSPYPLMNSTCNILQCVNQIQIVHGTELEHQ